jgi:hypothetical protein
MKLHTIFPCFYPEATEENSQELFKGPGNSMLYERGDSRKFWRKYPCKNDV